MPAWGKREEERIARSLGRKDAIDFISSSRNNSRRTEQCEVVGVEWDVRHFVRITQLQGVLVPGDEVRKNGVPPILMCPEIMSQGAGDIQESVEVMPSSSVQETRKDRG